MIQFEKYDRPKGEPRTDSLTVNKSKGAVNAIINVTRFQDKDTKQYVMYSPSLDITSYGETLNKAQQMLVSSVEDLFTHFIEISADELLEELKALGWTKNRLKNKVFSNLKVDANGELQNFNVMEGSVERLQMVA